MRGARTAVLAGVVACALAPSARGDARVSGARGTVEIQAGAGAWQPAETGATVPAGARVAARERATAQLAFGDDGKLALRADAVVAINEGAVRATVERGAVEQDLADAPDPVRLRTPAAQVEQKGGGAMVDVDDSGTTRVANLGGGTVKVRRVDKAGKPSGRSVVIAAGSGVVVAPGKAPARSRPLPTAPAWTSPATRVIAVGGRGAPITVAFAPIPGIADYRITVRTLGGDPVLALAATCDGAAGASGPTSGRSGVCAGAPGGPETGTITIHRMRPGAYVARVAAIDADGFESQPSAELPIEVIDLPVIAAGRDELLALSDDGGDPATPGPGLALDLGARLMVPAALTCRLGDDAPAPWVVVTTPGETALHCQKGGDELVAPAIDGRSHEVALAEAPRILPRSGPTRLRFTLRDPAAAPAIDAVATGLRVHTVEPDPGGVTVTVEPASAGGRLAELDLVLRDAPDVTLLRVALAIEPPVDVGVDRSAPPVIDVTDMGLEVGAYAGYLSFPSDVDGGSELGNADDPGYRVESGPTIGARVALWPIARIGLEAELGVTPTGYAGAPGRATVLGYRGQLAINIVRDGRFGLRAAVGAGAQTLVGSGEASTDTDSELHWGLGFSVGVTRRLHIRLDARHLVGPARDAGFASMFELDLGVGARFGN
jgi:hypothetical protein